MQSECVRAHSISMPSARKRQPERYKIFDTSLREVPVVPKPSPVVVQDADDDPSLKIAPRHPVGTGADRRRRWRAKISGRVHIRGGVGTIDAFEDVCKTIDVSRDGIFALYVTQLLLGRPIAASDVPLLDCSHGNQHGSQGYRRPQSSSWRVPLCRGD